jgi:fluoroquinolone resistance protein
VAKENIENQVFLRKKAAEIFLRTGEFENCEFNECDFSGSDFTDVKFWGCCFLGCNLSLVLLNKTSLRDVKFINCKMLGLQFDTCNEFGLSFGFENCILDHSSFYKRKIKKTIFKDSRLHEVDFTECDISGSVFSQCDLLQTTFFNTILEKADLRSSYNYSIDPDQNRIKKAKFSFPGAAGLLDKFDIEIE